MEEQQKPQEAEQQKESIDYSGAKKPWVNTLFVSAIIGCILWIRSLQDRIVELYEARLQDRDRLTELAIRLAEVSVASRREGDKAIYYQDSTAMRRRDFDSPLYPQQPINPDQK